MYPVTATPAPLAIRKLAHATGGFCLPAATAAHLPSCHLSVRCTSAAHLPFSCALPESAPPDTAGVAPSRPGAVTVVSLAASLSPACSFQLVHSTPFSLQITTAVLAAAPSPDLDPYPLAASFLSSLSSLHLTSSPPLPPLAGSALRDLRAALPSLPPPLRRLPRHLYEAGKHDGETSLALLPPAQLRLLLQPRLRFVCGGGVAGERECRTSSFRDDHEGVYVCEAGGRVVV